MRMHFIEAERSIEQEPTSLWYDTLEGKFFCPSLALATLASLTPRDIDVKIIDEKVEKIDLNDIPDAVAISFKTMSCKRAYELADFYREKGSKVVLGGIHVSLLPDEAKAHADSIVIGEGEEVWPQLVDDIRNDNLKSEYRASGLTDLATLKVPRFDLIKNKSYICHSIQSSRGCSLDCDFCPTREMFKGVFRTKPIEQVVEEIRVALAIDKKYIFFTDDIFGAGDKDFIVNLLAEIRKLKIEFFAVSDFLMLNKKIVIELALSGCRYLGLNLPGTCSKEEEKAIKMIQALGIDVWGYFMFGFKIHEKNVFQKAYEFTKRTNMRHASFTVMAPYPSTKAFSMLSEQRRILTRDWSLYDQAHVVCKPQNFSADELDSGFKWIKAELGHLSRFRSDENRSLLKVLTGKTLSNVLAVVSKARNRN
ncbi:B12-binding domain-containing radical SAM protein [Candidatus Omnitrophota bacterium]